ncbi:MAG: SDR family NAD(P)-dependent oxidoreductase [Actinomycetota bacterium]
MEAVKQEAVAPPSVDLTGRVAIVTGAGRGMGRAEAIDLAAHGAHVAILDVDGDEAGATADVIEAAGAESLAVPGDMAHPETARDLVASAIARWGRLDIVVNNAGTIHSGTGIRDTTDEEWHRTLAVHLDGAFYLVRAAVPHLAASPAGRIVLVSSLWAQIGPGHSHAYCAAKGALLAFSRNLAVELAPDGICVNALAPGGVSTRMAEEQSEEEYRLDLADIPLGRYAAPGEIAAWVSFLASDAGAFFTGQTVSINGGQFIGW